MVGKDDQSAFGCQQLGGGCQHFLQGFHFVVDGNAECLKHFGHILLLAGGTEERTHAVGQVACGGEGSLAAAADKHHGQTVRILQFAIEAQDAREFFFVGGIEELGGRHSCAAIHAHI